MLLGFRTIAFKRFPLETALRSISKMGYDGVELCLENEELKPLSLSSDAIEKIKRILKDLDLSISALSLHTDFVENEQDFREVFKGIELTKEFGHNIFIISPGYTRNRDKRLLLNDLKTKLRVLLDEAEKHEVILALEAEPGMIIETAEETLDLINFFSSENLKINLDIGHSYCIGEHIKSSIITLKNYIVHFHLEDIKGRVHKHLVPGEGDLDIKEILQTLQDISYKGFITVDLFDLETPEVAAELSIRRLRTIINELK